MVYILGNLADWRTIALYCAIVPIVSFVALFFVSATLLLMINDWINLRNYIFDSNKIPETPVWLLSKNREKDALKSLCWLRGWTSTEAVRDEFDSLKEYSEVLNACNACQRAMAKCCHPPPTLVDQFNAMFNANCMKPLIIFFLCSIFSNFAGLHHIFPYTVQILNTFDCPFNPNKAIVNVSIARLGACQLVWFEFRLFSDMVRSDQHFELDWIHICYQISGQTQLIFPLISGNGDVQFIIR